MQSWLVKPYIFNDKLKRLAAMVSDAFCVSIQGRITPTQAASTHGTPMKHILSGIR